METSPLDYDKYDKINFIKKAGSAPGLNDSSVIKNKRK